MAKQLPAKTKYRKVQKGRNRGTAKGGNHLAFGDFGLQVTELGTGYGRLSSNVLEAVRVAITRHMKRRGKVWLRVFPHMPVTKKPAETRMGKGKGGVEYWAARVKPGTIIVEMGGVSATLAREALRLADAKLPFRCRFISRAEQEQY